MKRFKSRDTDIFEALGDFSPVAEFIRAFGQVEDPETRCDPLIKVLPYLYQRVDTQPDGPGEQGELLRLIKGSDTPPRIA